MLRVLSACSNATRRHSKLYSLPLASAANLTDQALTRVYNQPTKELPNGKHVGLLYKNPIDCLWKTLQTEGPLGWYKGMHRSFTPS